MSYKDDGKKREAYLDKLVQLDTKFTESVPAKIEFKGNAKVVEAKSDELNSLLRRAEYDPERTFTASTSSKTELDDFTYTELKNFIQALKNSGSNGINISSYSVAESFFTSTGYDFTDNNTSRPFHSGAKYTHNNGNDVYYTRLTMSDIESNNNFRGSTIFDTWLSMTYKYGIMIEYIRGTNTAKLYLDDYGLKVYDVELALSQLNGNYNNIFTNRNITGSVYDNNYDVTGLIGLIPETQYLLAFWGVFSTEGTNQFNAGTFDFGNTVSEQLVKYDEVVRGISMDSNTTYMRSESDRMRIEGEIRFQSTASWSWGYNYWVNTF